MSESLAVGVGKAVAGKVEGCPWCWNRTADHPIPRPFICFGLSAIFQ
jgi:hypothetical protein